MSSLPNATRLILAGLAIGIALVAFGFASAYIRRVKPQGLQERNDDVRHSTRQAAAWGSLSGQKYPCLRKPARIWSRSRHGPDPVRTGGADQGDWQWERPPGGPAPSRAGGVPRIFRRGGGLKTPTRSDVCNSSGTMVKLMGVAAIVWAAQPAAFQHRPSESGPTVAGRTDEQIAGNAGLSSSAVWPVRVQSLRRGDPPWHRQTDSDLRRRNLPRPTMPGASRRTTRHLARSILLGFDQPDRHVAVSELRVSARIPANPAQMLLCSGRKDSQV